MLRLQSSRLASSALTSSSSFVRVVEVGARDGLQNESTLIPTATKITLLDRLADCGIQNLEGGSFVSPKWVPQMADSEAVWSGLPSARKSSASFSFLVPNLKGLAAALKAGVNEIAVFGSASEAFSLKNINMSVEKSLESFRDVCTEALKHKNMKVRGYVSCVLGCPYSGKVEPETVKAVAEALLQMGCYEVSLGDTIGVGTFKEMARLLNVLTKNIEVKKLAVHCHNTYGQALANIATALNMGVRTVDSSVAGLGGCPYAKGATGNVATEDVVYMLHRSGFETGIDLDKLISVGNWITAELKKERNSSAVGTAMTAAKKSKESLLNNNNNNNNQRANKP